MKRKGRRRTEGLVGSAGAMTIALAGIALASTYGRTEAELPFTTPVPGTSTGLGISIHYRDARDPNAKPSTFRRLEIELPPGTRLDPRAVPKCSASDAELMAQGPSACDARSKVGDGTVTLLTGFPPPADTLTADVTILQGEDDLLDVFRPHGSEQTVAVDHVGISGRTLIDEPQSVPGGPPDARSAVRDVRLRIGARTSGGRAYLRTPAECPAARAWRSRFTVLYDDGITDVAHATSQCRPRASAARMRLTVQPNEVRMGVRSPFVFRVLSTYARCRQGTLIRFAGARLRTDRHGYAPLVRRLQRAGRARAVATHAGCGTAATSVRVVAP